MQSLLAAQVNALEAEVARLKETVDILERRNAFLGQYRTLARGMAGERLISRLVGGALTAHTAPVDLHLSDGTAIEIKFATISRSSKGYDGGRRWQWQKVFGENNLKSYDFLFLVGEADPAHQPEYREPESPYVIFVVPFGDVQPLTTAGTRGARGILLSTNPRRARGTAAELFASYQRTVPELTTQFGTL